MPDETQPPPQRDWLGHGMQFLGILAVIGLPLMYWGSNMNIAVATLVSEQNRQKTDITEQRQVQTIVANQMLEVNRQLARIETLVGDMREKRR